MATRKLVGHFTRFQAFYGEQSDDTVCGKNGFPNAIMYRIAGLNKIHVHEQFYRRNPRKF